MRALNDESVDGGDLVARRRAHGGWQGCGACGLRGPGAPRAEFSCESSRAGCGTGRSPTNGPGATSWSPSSGRFGARGTTRSAKGARHRPGVGVKAKSGPDRAPLDASMARLLRRFEYKSKWYGRTCVAVDREFPSIGLCHVYGEVNHALAIDETERTCADCGTHHDNRDESLKAGPWPRQRVSAGRRERCPEHRDRRHCGIPTVK